MLNNYFITGFVFQISHLPFSPALFWHFDYFSTLHTLPKFCVKFIDIFVLWQVKCVCSC